MSYFAPSSDGKDFQKEIALSQLSPEGAYGLPFMYSKVFSSGAIKPALAPASILILQIVILPSIERLEIASPEYSMTYPVPPAVPI